MPIGMAALPPNLRVLLCFYDSKEFIFQMVNKRVLFGCKMVLNVVRIKKAWITPSLFLLYMQLHLQFWKIQRASDLLPPLP